MDNADDERKPGETVNANSSKYKKNGEGLSLILNIRTWY